MRPFGNVRSRCIIIHEREPNPAGRQFSSEQRRRNGVVDHILGEINHMGRAVLHLVNSRIRSRPNRRRDFCANIFCVKRGLRPIPRTERHIGGVGCPARCPVVRLFNVDHKRGRPSGPHPNINFKRALPVEVAVNVWGHGVDARNDIRRRHRQRCGCAGAVDVDCIEADSHKVHASDVDGTASRSRANQINQCAIVYRVFEPGDRTAIVGGQRRDVQNNVTGHRRRWRQGVGRRGRRDVRRDVGFHRRTPIISSAAGLRCVPIG